MKHLFLTLLILNSWCVLSQNQAAEKEAVRKVIEDFFVAFHQKDTLTLQKLCHAKLTLTSIFELNEVVELKNETPTGFFKAISSIPNSVSFEEKIHDMRVSVDGNMAHVWATYSFFIQKKLSHAGVNSIHLIKQDDQWKILDVLDTRRK